MQLSRRLATFEANPALVINLTCNLEFGIPINCCFHYDLNIFSYREANILSIFISETTPLELKIKR
jgi:hypothetical protein